MTQKNMSLFVLATYIYIRLHLFIQWLSHNWLFLSYYIGEHWTAMQTKMFQNRKKQAGAELCQVQAQVGLTAEAELILVMSSMEAVFHLSKIE